MGYSGFKIASQSKSATNVINKYRAVKVFSEDQRRVIFYAPENKAEAAKYALLNAYDNSLLYTDRMLSEAIESLQEAKCIAAWLFVSDHGEYIYGNICGHGFSYSPQKDEYHVPLMVWYSDEYKEAYPNKVANVKKHKHESVCADYVFWSVLGITNIRIDKALQQEGKSIFEEQLKQESRTLLLPNGQRTIKLK